MITISITFILLSPKLSRLPLNWVPPVSVSVAAVTRSCDLAWGHLYRLYIDVFIVHLSKRSFEFKCSYFNMLTR